MAVLIAAACAGGGEAKLQESTHSGRLESTYNGPRLRRWTSHLVGKSPVALLNDLSGRLPYGPASLRLQARS